MNMEDEEERGGCGATASTSSADAERLRLGGGGGGGGVFTTVLLYETRARFYVVQGTEDKSSWRILKVSREETHDRKLEMSEDVTVYTEAQCSRRGERPLTPRWQSLH